RSVPTLAAATHPSAAPPPLTLTPPPPASTRFPYTTLFRSRPRHADRRAHRARTGRLPRASAGTGRQPGGRTTAERCLRLGDHRRSEEHTSELQSRENLVCRLLLERKKRRRADRPLEGSRDE